MPRCLWPVQGASQKLFSLRARNELEQDLILKIASFLPFVSLRSIQSQVNVRRFYLKCAFMTSTPATKQWLRFKESFSTSSRTRLIKWWRQTNSRSRRQFAQRVRRARTLIAPTPLLTIPRLLDSFDAHPVAWTPLFLSSWSKKHPCWQAEVGRSYSG